MNTIYINTKEMAKLLNLSESTIRRWVRKGKLNCTFDGRKLKFSQKNIDSFSRKNELKEHAILVFKNDLHDLMYNLKHNNTDDDLVNFVKTFIPTEDEEKAGIKKSKYLLIEVREIPKNNDSSSLAHASSKVMLINEKHPVYLALTESIVREEYEVMPDGNYIRLHMTTMGKIETIPIKPSYVKDRHGNTVESLSRYVKNGKVQTERKPAVIDTIRIYFTEYDLADDMIKKQIIATEKIKAERYPIENTIITKH